jgi:tRNA modification GTPase
MPTIAAIATGPAAGGVGIVRLSGPAALAAARRVAPTLPASPPPRVAAFHRFVDVAGRPVDEGLVLYFPAPRSFTGDDVVELHAHGAPRLLTLLLEEVLRHEGVRLAEPGEFTRRAYLAGRVDLARAEAVADLVAAESEAQVRAAAAQLTGQLSARLEAVVAPLLALHADLEGVLDFPDEAEGADADAGPRLERALADVRALLADGARGALVRRGAKVVLYGPVNAGKSTLFNALVGAARALVDPEPGTTRDALEARLELEGLAVTLVDTAGLRDTPGRVEALGIARTREALQGADLGVLVLPVDVTEGQRMAWQVECDDERRLEVSGKADLSVAWSLPGEAPLAVSGLTGVGVAALRRELASRLGGGVAQAALVSSQRHLDALGRAAQHLEQAKTAQAVSTLEVVAGEVGLALGALHEVTGADASSALLDAIFQRFCIGK